MFAETGVVCRTLIWRTKGRRSVAGDTEGRPYRGLLVEPDIDCYGDECKAVERLGSQLSLSGFESRRRCQVRGIGEAWSSRFPVTEEITGSNPVYPACGCGREEFRRLSSKEVYVGSNPTIRAFAPEALTAMYTPLKRGNGVRLSAGALEAL